jgi:hypothetical protein
VNSDTTGAWSEGFSPFRSSRSITAAVQHAASKCCPRSTEPQAHGPIAPGSPDGARAGRRTGEEGGADVLAGPGDDQSGLQVTRNADQEPHGRASEVLATTSTKPRSVTLSVGAALRKRSRLNAPPNVAPGILPYGINAAQIARFVREIEGFVSCAICRTVTFHPENSGKMLARVGSRRLRVTWPSILEAAPSYKANRIGPCPPGTVTLLRREISRVQRAS